MLDRKLLQAGLLHTSPSSSTNYVYTESPTGKLDLPRLLDRKADCWLLPVTASELQKKKIIISDFSVRYDLDQNQNIESFWLDLLNQGFELYVWTGKITPIHSKKDLHNALKTVEIIHPNDLARKLATSGISSDQSYIADFGHTKQLPGILNNHNANLILDLIKLTRLTPDELVKLLTSIPDNPAVTLKIQNVDDLFNPAILDFLQRHQSLILKCSLTYDQLAEFSEKCPSMKHLEFELDRSAVISDNTAKPIKFEQLEFLDIQDLNADEVTVNSLLAGCPAIKSLLIDSQYFKDFKFSNLPKLEKLESLTLRIREGTQNPEKFLALLGNSPALKHLSFYNYTNTVLDFPDNMAPLKELESLEGSFGKISDASLSRMLSGNTSLKNLNIQVRDASQITSIITAQTNLEKLVVSDANFDSRSVNTLLKNNPALKYLVFPKCDNYSAVIENLPPLSQLEELIISAKITGDQLGELLRLCPALKQLYINSDNLASFPDNLPALPQLKDLTIQPNGASLSAESFKRILKISPALQKLHLYNIVEISGLPLEIPPLPQLEELNIILNDAVVNQPDIKRILLATPSLKKLFISSSNRDLELNLSGLLSLNNLTILEMYGVNFSRFTTQDLKQKITSIKKLNLRNCSNINYFFDNFLMPELADLNLHTLPNFSKIIDKIPNLSQLDNLSLDSLKIDNTDLSKLLSLATSISHLSLMDCKNISNIPSDITQLPLLERMYISQLNINNIDMNKLINKAPSLRSVSVSNCPNIDGKSKYFANKNVEISIYNSNTTSYNAHSTTLSTTSYLDKNTYTDPHTEYPAYQYFAIKNTGEPFVENYRLQVLDKTIVDELGVRLGKTPIAVKIIPSISESPDIIKDIYSLYHEKYEQSPTHFYGQIDLPTGLETWFPLPSLSTQDKISRDLIQTIPPIDFDLGYCKKDDLYYIKPKKPLINSVTATFIVNANFSEENIDVNMDKNDIETFQSFQFNADGSLLSNNAPVEKLDWRKLAGLVKGFKNKKLVKKPKNDLELLNTIMHEMKGVCSHRAKIFMAIAEKAGIKARAINNDVHEFVEVFDKDLRKWIKLDLGGGPGVISTFNMIIPEVKHAEPEIPIMNPPASSNPFRTWETTTSPADSAEHFCRDLLNKADTLSPGKKNILTKLRGDQIESMHTAIMRYARENKHNCYFISDLDEIHDVTYCIDNTSGNYHAEDSALIRFIKQAKPGDVLMVDWSHYESSHVGFNTMIDAQRKLKGIPIPPGVIVMGLLDQTQTMGDDFYSRYRVNMKYPDSTPTLSVLPSEVTILQENENDLPCINFYDDDWKSTLLGELQIKLGKYHFSPSKLPDALNAKSKIVLRNAPWHLPEFRKTITELLTKTTLEINGIIYQIPDEFGIIRLDQPYDLRSDCYDITPYSKDLALHDAVILNDFTYNQFFTNYICNASHDIEDRPGFLASSKEITAVVTEKLSNGQWAELIESAKITSTKLHLVAAPGVTLPEAMMQTVTPDVEMSDLKPYKNHGSSTTKKRKRKLSHDPVPQRKKQKLHHFNSRVIYTNDIERMAEDIACTTTISVNEKTSYADLIESVKFDDLGTKRLFMHHQSVLATALLDGKNIVLKGNLSATLMKQLETLFLPQPYLWINGRRYNLQKGQITFITDKKIDSGLIQQHIHQFKDNDLWEKLASNNMFDAQLVQNFKKVCDTYYAETNEKPFSYIQLKEMLTLLKNNPGTNPLKSFIRLKANYTFLNQQAKLAWQQFSSDKVMRDALDKPVDVMAKRFNKLVAELNVSPYLFVVGASGVGKSSFIQKELKKIAGKKVTIKEGMDQLKNWATPAEPDEMKILFIDEANLYADGSFDIFEGLFQNPPGLIINGEFKEIPATHKVIFAGNFGNFKGRQQHGLFDRHGHVITFKEFPDAYLAEKFIEPILCINNVNKQPKTIFQSIYGYFKNFIPEHNPVNASNSKQIDDIFLSIYHHINNLFPDTHPVTLRNLQMMAQRLMLMKNNMPNLQTAACMAAYDEASGVLDQTQRRLLSTWIKNTFTVDVREIKKELKRAVTFKSHDFLMTKRRINPVRILNNLFDIRDRQIALSTYTGTCGLILEGESGIGKSKLALEYLQARGFKNGNDVAYANDKTPQKRFYYLTPTDPISMQDTLVRAFHEGAAVVIDEMNTLPLENILNPLLSGVDLTGKSANHPGFFIIGTQNPVNYGKRQILSSALLNRFQKLDLKEYGKEDLSQIAQYMLHDVRKAEQLLNDYLIASEYAQVYKKFPAPTPRDFMTSFKI